MSDLRIFVLLGVLVWVGNSNDGFIDYYDINKFLIGVFYMDKIIYIICDYFVLKDDNDILYWLIFLLGFFFDNMLLICLLFDIY